MKLPRAVLLLGIDRRDLKASGQHNRSGINGQLLGHLCEINTVCRTCLFTLAAKQAVFNIGATDFIGKPFNALDLLTRTRAHIDGRQINRKRRMSDVVQSEQDLLASPSAFHSVGCQALEYALENNTDFIPPVWSDLFFR